jgi:hypothetical protein
MKRISFFLTIAVCATTVAAAVTVQAGQSMNKSAMDDMMMTTTYTGCVEAVNHGGSFLLTHLDNGHMDDMHGDTSMTHDRTMHKADADSMDHQAMPKPGTAVVLSGKSDLRKHVGQKVTVTGALSNGSPGSGRDDLTTLSIESFKVVAKTCSQEGR